ncbi:tetratricopeptide repeat protein [Desulfoplanes sp.]
MKNHTMYILSATLMVLCCSACTTSHPPQKNIPPEWNLSSSARASFAYLKFQELKQRGQNQEAIASLDEAIGILASPYLYLEKAEMLWQRKEIAPARDSLKEGIERFPESRDLYLSLAKTYEAARRWEDATTTLQEYLQLHPESWSMVQEVGALLIKQKEYARALDELQTIPENSRDASGWYLIGKAASKLGLQERAVSAYTKALAKDPHFFRAKAELGYLYEQEKKYVEALKIYEELASQGEPGSPLLLTMIRLQIKLNGPDKAFELTKQLPEDVDFQIDAANLFLNQDFYSYAAGILEPLADIEDLPSKGWFTLALLAYEGQRSPQKAETYLSNIPEDAPYFERALLFRADILYGLERYQDAGALVDQGIRMFPKQPSFILLKASLLKNRGEWEQAADLLGEAHTTWPESIDVLFNLGVLWDDQGNKTKGMEYMEKIIAIDPDYPEALNYLGYTLAEQGRNLDRALVLVKNALKGDPGNGYYLDSLAWVLFKLGKLDQAWEAIRQAVQLADEDPTIWEHYGTIAGALGKKDAARKGKTNAQRFRTEKPAKQ